MTVQEGMDSARIRQIAGQLEGEVNRLGDILGKGNSSASVLQSNWGGDDGQALLVRWRDEAAKQIGAASESLRGAAKQLTQQAEQQDQASGEGGGGGPGGPGGGPSFPFDRLPKLSGETPYDAINPGGPGFHRPGDQDSWITKTNRDADGNIHRYDPITGKRWQEAEDGSWKRSQDPLTGHDTRTKVDKTEGDNGWETKHESTRGEGGGRKEYGESWSKEKSFDDNKMQDVKKVVDGVQSEPIVEKELWKEEAQAAVLKGEVGNSQTGASGEVLSADASTEGKAGFDATRGGYVEGNAQAGAYIGKGEAHWGNEHGTSAQVEGYVGAQVEAKGGAEIGPGGAKVEAGVGGFAGGKIEGGVSQDLGPANVGASGSLSYGIGAHADVGGEISADKVGVSVDVGATLGLGGSVKFDVSVSPNEIISDLGDAGEAIADSKANPANWW